MLAKRFEDILHKLGMAGLEHPLFYHAPVGIRFEIGGEEPIYLDRRAAKLKTNPAYVQGALDRAAAIYRGLPAVPDLLRIDGPDEEPAESLLTVIRQRVGLPVPDEQLPAIELDEDGDAHAQVQFYWDLSKINFQPELLLREIILGDIGGWNGFVSSVYGGSDERRRFMDVVISQYDKEYLEALIRYNKALVQRNSLLKSEFPVEEELFLVWEEMMSQAGEIVFRKREAFIREFIPIFQSFYSFISQDKEAVGLSYESHARDASLLEVLKQSRERDKIMGFSLRGIHKDELNMLLGEFPIKKEGSQGQNKTYLVALKLAQFDFLKRTGRTVPLLLLDDIFDKLDASRVEQIVKLVGGDNFGQIFITDTNRGHLDRILHKVGSDYKIFRVEEGTIQEMEADDEAQ